MEKPYLFAAIISLGLITLCFSYFDIVLSFSDKFMWWDSWEHFIGGVTVGFAALFLLTLLRFPHDASHVVFVVFCVGVIWEIMEAHYGIGGSQWMGYWTDTIKDLVCDVIGGYVAVRTGYMLRRL